MGKTTTPKYRVEIRTNTSSFPMAWSGPATPKRLEDTVERYNRSFMPGGVNGHVSDKVIVQIDKAQLINQATGEVVAEWSAPMFSLMFV